MMQPHTAHTSYQTKCTDWTNWNFCEILRAYPKSQERQFSHVIIIIRFVVHDDALWFWYVKRDYVWLAPCRWLSLALSIMSNQINWICLFWYLQEIARFTRIYKQHADKRHLRLVYKFTEIYLFTGIWVSALCFILCQPTCDTHVKRAILNIYTHKLADNAAISVVIGALKVARAICES